MKLLVTGGCGFLGSNIAQRGLARQETVIVFDSLYRQGASANLEWLRQQGDVIFVHGDIRNPNDIATTIQTHQPDAIFHLAGQVAMTTSIANPRFDFEVNALGSFNLLEAVRHHAPQCPIVYSSTNKVYGDLEELAYQETETRYRCPQYPQGFDELTRLDFHSPYGTSKGAADQYMLDYARIFGLNTVVFRHSSIYGSRQFSTFDQGWIGWFCQKALEAKHNPRVQPFTIAGNGKQVRDVLHAEDAVDCYFAAISHIDQARGQAFNIGGSIDNSLSLLELFQLLENITGATMNYESLPPRISDQKIFVANIQKVQQHLGWSPKINVQDGIRTMVDWTTKIMA